MSSTQTKFFIRRSVALAAAACLAAAFVPARSQNAAAELKITAPAGAGGGWDSTARALQQVMVAVGAAKSVQVVNVPGAGGTVGLAQFVNTAKGDGNQLMMMGGVMVGAILTNKAPVDLSMTTPISRLTGESLVVVVPANSPHKSMKDLAAAIKADTSKVVWAGGSAGGTDHILAGLISKVAGGNAAQLNYVPFSGGGEALAEMLGGRVTAGISGYSEFESMIKAGKLRALGVSSATRMADVAIPTIKEQGLNIEFLGWRGLVAAPGITDAQKKALLAAVDKAVKSPEWAAVRKQRNWDDAYLSGDVFARYLKEEQVRVKDVLTTIGLVK